MMGVVIVVPASADNPVVGVTVKLASGPVWGPEESPHAARPAASANAATRDAALIWAGFVKWIDPTDLSTCIVTLVS
jgi:hypothetical protein